MSRSQLQYYLKGEARLTSLFKERGPSFILFHRNGNHYHLSRAGRSPEDELAYDRFSVMLNGNIVMEEVTFDRLVEYMLKV